MGDNETAEEERLMRHISKKRTTTVTSQNTQQQSNQQPNLPKRNSFTYKKPDPTPVQQQSNQQPKKWQQHTVDLDMKKKAEEMERQRQEEVRQQQEIDRKLREQAQGKSTRNDFSIDRFLIKQDDSSNLKSGNHEHEERNEFKAHAKEDDDALSKEEQRLMKKLGEKSKPVLYTPEAIEEHRKKLESQVGGVKQEAPNVVRPTSGPSSANPKQKLAATISKNLSAARSRKPKDFSLITTAAEWLYKFNTFLTKVQGSLLFTKNNFSQFDFQSFENGSVGIVSFIADNLTSLDHEKKPLKNYDDFINAGIKLVEKIASSTEWSNELESNLIEVQKSLFELVSDVLKRAIELEEKARRKEEIKSHLSIVIFNIFEISQNLNTAVMDYSPTEFKSLLRKLVKTATSTYDYINEDKLDPIVDLIQSIIDSAKKFMQSSGEDTKENANFHQKILTLMNKLQEQIDKAQ